MIIQKQLNSYKDGFTRVKLIKNLLGRTCLFLLMSYILFHFINDDYGFSRIEKLQYSLNEEKILLFEKIKLLDSKKLMVSKIKEPYKDLDLIDSLIRKELGYTNSNEITVVLDSNNIEN